LRSYSSAKSFINISSGGNKTPTTPSADAIYFRGPDSATSPYISHGAVYNNSSNRTPQMGMFNQLQSQLHFGGARSAGPNNDSDMFIADQSGDDARVMGELSMSMDDD
jgi:hypothetical protein